MSEQKKCKGGFVRIPNEIVRSNKISLAAKGLYVYICSECEGWEFTYRRMAQETGAGRDAIRGALDELIAAGLIVQGPRVQKPDGKWGGYTYTVTGTFAPASASAGRPTVVEPTVVEPTVVEPHAKKTTSKKTTNKKTNVVLPPELAQKYEELFGVAPVGNEAVVLGEQAANMSTDVCFLALQVAQQKNAESPAYYAAKVLGNWQAQGHRTVEDVLAANPRLVPSSASTTPPDPHEIERMKKLRARMHNTDNTEVE